MFPGETEAHQSLLVSIVLCTYNGEKYIAEQLNSICNQRYQNLEIIICDDASTDDTMLILSRFSEKDPRIRLEKNAENLGFAKNFNSAVSRATGAIVGFADQDDVWHPDKIATLLANWPPGSPLIYCNSVRFFNEGEKDWNRKGNRSYRRFEGTDLRKIAIFNTVSGHALLMRRELVARVFPVPEGLVYDWYGAAVAACSGGVSYWPQTMVLQRVHAANTTVNGGFEFRPGQQNHSFKCLVDLHLNVFQQLPGAHQKFMQQLYGLWHGALTKPFSRRLFLFIARHQKILLWKKKKMGGLLSRIRNNFV